MEQRGQLQRFMQESAERLGEFLRDELDLAVTAIEYHFDEHERLELRYLTSLLGIKGKMELFTLFSYDQPLIETIFQRYTAELEIEDEEQTLLMEETSGDLLNIVIGNVLGGFTHLGSRATVTPPLTLGEAKTLARHRKATVHSADLLTADGVVSIFCVWPNNPSA